MQLVLWIVCGWFVSTGGLQVVLRVFVAGGFAGAGGFSGGFAGGLQVFLGPLRSVWRLRPVCALGVSCLLSQRAVSACMICLKCACSENNSIRTGL